MILSMFYLFHGTDEFSMREALAAHGGQGGFELNVDVYSGAETDVATILATCDTLPFLSERRLVVVEGLPKRRRAAKPSDGAEADSSPAAGAIAEDAGRTPTTKGKKARAATGPDPRAFAQALADHARRLPETTDLVVLTDEQIEMGSPLLDAAARYGKARLFLPPKGAQLETWLSKRAQALGVRLTPDAARLLADAVGSDLRVLASEVDKLATYVGAQGVISPAEVKLLTPTTHQARVFDLTDALARRDRARALGLLHELLDAGESPLGIVALTAHQTRSLLQVKALAQRGLRPAQIAQTAGMSPYVVEKSLPLARQFTFAQLEAAHHALLRVYTALKLSKMTPAMALDLLVVEFGK